MMIMMIFMIIAMFNWIFEWSKKNFFFCFCFFVCMYKMVTVNKETYENNDIEAIIDGIGKLWLNEKHVEEKLGHKNLPAITNK